MAAVRVQAAASHRLDEIYRYTPDRCGTEQAIIGLFEAFDKIETHGVVSKPVPAEFGVEGTTFGTNGISSIGESCRTATSAS